MANKEENFIDLPGKISRNAQDRYIENLGYEKEMDKILDQFGHINGQGRHPVGQMHFGSAKAKDTACEIIAVYNVLKDLGKESRLSDLIFYGETSGYLFLSGFFGTKVSKIGNMLSKYGIDYEKMSVKSFVELARVNKFTDGQIFIITIKNNSGYAISSLHTFEMVYYGKKWVVFNRFNNSNKPKVYDSLGAVLQNGKTIGSFFYIYKIKAEAGKV